MKKAIVLLTFISSVIVSCRDDKQIDVQSPVISSITVNGQDIQTFDLTSGTEINISVVITDNEDLNQVRLSLTPDDSDRGTPNTGFWDELEIRNISGTSTNQVFNFTVPDSISGFWKLSIDCTDDLGNPASSSFDIAVINPNAPSVTGSTSPQADAAGVVTMAAGTNLIVNGEAVDSDNFEYLKVYLMNLSGNVLSNLNIEPLMNSPMGFSGASFDNAQPGSYRLVIEAKDQLGYISKWGVFVNVQ